MASFPSKQIVVELSGLLSKLFHTKSDASYLAKLLFSAGLELFTTRCHLGQDLYLWLDGFSITALFRAEGFT
jgi:hypothetical protein